MNIDQIKQAVETIRTLNINFNDATTQKIADAIIPVVRFYFIQQIVMQILSGILLVTVCYLAFKLIWHLIDSRKEVDMKKAEKQENY